MKWWILLWFVVTYGVVPLIFLEWMKRITERRVVSRGTAATADAEAASRVEETPRYGATGSGASCLVRQSALDAWRKTTALPGCDEREYVPVQTAGKQGSANPAAALPFSLCESCRTQIKCASQRRCDAPVFYGQRATATNRG